MELELLKLLPGGSAVLGTIIVVVLFLRQQDKMNVTLNSITDKNNAQATLNQKAFQDQITSLSAQSYANQKLYQDQIKALIDDHMIVTRETITAVKAVEATVRELQVIVQNLSHGQK